MNAPKKILKNCRPPDYKLKNNLQVPCNWSLYPNPNDPTWRKHGLSQSLIAKFIVCRERFRLRTVEGLTSGGSKEAMEFGTIFHKALELNAQGKTTSQIFSHLRTQAKLKNYDLMLCRIAALMVTYYLKFWKDQLKTARYIETEEVFEIPYKCMGSTIMLRGRRDQAYMKDGRLWLQENKTKSQVNEDQIQMTLGYMLQPMLYLLSIKHDNPSMPLGGILYNIIRKPQLKQNSKESDSAYLDRIAADIEERPDHYFKMFEVEIDDAHLKMWEQRYFYPLICQIKIWWDSIKHNPFDPWVGEDGQPNPHHYLRPFGIYDPMSHGLGEYFVRVVNGIDAGLTPNSDVFSELELDEPTPKEKTNGKKNKSTKGNSKLNSSSKT